MAALAIKLQIFISSPSDVQAERDAADAVISELAREAARQDLLLTTYRFEDEALPSVGRPVDQSNVDLRSSELVVVILGDRLGSPSTVDGTETGTLEELRIATDLVRTGRADNLFVYYRVDPSTREASSGVAAFIKSLSSAKRQTMHRFTDTATFTALFERDLRRWLENWDRIPLICRRALETSNLAAEASQPVGENRLEIVLQAQRQEADPERRKLLGIACLERYQAMGPAAADEPLRGRFSGFDPLLVGSEDAYRFTHPEFFYYACAVGLQHAIANDLPQYAERLAYINPIHQYLSAIITREDVSVYARVLTSWLSRREGNTRLRPTARNFAAYVLGMIGARDAAEQLAESLENDLGDKVQLYCITSLAKLRSRPHIPALRRVYENTGDVQLRTISAQAIARLVGIARFEL